LLPSARIRPRVDSGRRPAGATSAGVVGGRRPDPGYCNDRSRVAVPGRRAMVVRRGALEGPARVRRATWTVGRRRGTGGGLGAEARTRLEQTRPRGPTRRPARARAGRPYGRADGPEGDE